MNLIKILFCLYFSLCNINCWSQEKDIIFKNKVIDFGNVPNDTLLTGKFIMKNIGEKKIKINYVNPECSCTNYKTSKLSISSKDSVIITLSVNTKGKFGKQKIYAIVNYGEEKKMSKLTIKCNIYEK